MFSTGSAPPIPSKPIRPVRDGLIVGLAVLAVSLLSIAFLERGAKDAVQGEMRGNLIRSAELASALVDGDSMEILHNSRNERSATYLRHVAGLRRVLENSKSIRYVYTMAQDGDSLRFVLDASPSRIDPKTRVQQHSVIGEVYHSSTPSMLEALHSGKATSEEEPVTDKWGSFISGYAPIRNRHGVIVGIVGVDMFPDAFLKYQSVLRTRSLLAQGIMVLFSLLTGFFVWQSQDRRRRHEKERQEAQERLLLSEEKYRMLFETAGTAIVVFGPDRTIRMINRICEELYGWSRSEIEGKLPWTTFIHAQDLSRVLQYAEKRSTDFGAAPRQYECRVIHRSGDLRHVTFSLAQIPGTDLLVCSLIERTSLVTAWQELEESRRRYQVIFEVTDTPMLVFDEENRIQLANESCLKLVQRPRDQIEGHLWTEFVHPEDLPTLMQFQLDAGDVGPWRVTQRILAHDDLIRHLNFVISRLPGTNWCIAAGLDLTERIEAEQALQSINENLDTLVQERTAELETALRSREDFLSSMSHELRTPLQAIQASTEILLESSHSVPESDGQTRHLKTIQRSSSHLLALISDILDLAKSMAGHLQIRTTTVDVQSVCREALDLIDAAATRRHLVTRFLCDQDQPALQADPVRLKQMLVNVLGNAVKFTPSGGEITLEVRSDKDRLHFVVRDNGIGIHTQDQLRLFQPFVQLDNSLARIHAGTGLGLALVQRLAQAHGGTVSLESEPSFGTTVTISLPWEGQSTPAPLQDESTASDPGHPRPRGDSPLVLLAEDNLDIRECVCEYLEGLGYRTLTASNGQEAIEAAWGNSPDIILMDVQMPLMDGLEATRRLRLDDRTKVTPIVAMTALAQDSDTLRCLEAGSTAYLAKPVRLKDLATTVEGLCPRRDPAA
ncbi:MAG: hypothetical protein RL318_2592 [Fibrobacterota bacterium]|jgi:PAS domain S-box-containing protein